MVENYGIKHLKTPLYCPQSNASERVNQSVIAAIRPYLETDQREWDEHLGDIECTLRSTVHAATGRSPYFALFFQNMITHGSMYRLAKQLQALVEGENRMLLKQTQLELIRSKIQDNLHKVHERGEQVYNTRGKEVSYIPCQEVYRKNFIQSDFSKNINAKLCPKYINKNSSQWKLVSNTGSEWKVSGYISVKYIRP